MTEVDAFLSDLQRLAQAADPQRPGDFYEALLSAAAAAVGGSAGAIEPIGPDAARHRWPGTGGAEGTPLLDRSAVERVRAGRTPRVEGGLAGGVPVVAAPIDGIDGPVAVLALGLPGGAGGGAAIELAGAVAEVASRFEVRRAAARVAARQERLAESERLSLTIQGARRWGEVARAVANGGRSMVDCDRLAVLERRGRGWWLAAVSGVERPSRRSDAARGMERLAAEAHRWERVVRLPTHLADEPPALARALDAYAEAAGVRGLRFVPCSLAADADGRAAAPTAALLAEWFDGSLEGPAAAAADARLDVLARHVAVARRRVGSGRSRGVRALPAIGALALIGGAAVLSLVPATLWVTVEGRFEHAELARVFAPLDAVVEELTVAEGDRVAAGQTVVRLTSAELRVQQEEVAEAIAAAEAEVAALDTARLRSALPGADEAVDPSAQASRVAALREALEHQRARRDLLAAEAARLVVVSPIDGVVVTWRPAESLVGRPVRRGERLLEVAREDAWVLELDAPDHRSGRLLAAREAGGGEAVRYVVRADPSVTHTARVRSVADATHADADGNPVVRIVAVPDNPAAAKPRGGLGVSAKIGCGQHPLGIVWLHEAIDAVRRRLF